MFDLILAASMFASSPDMMEVSVKIINPCVIGQECKVINNQVLDKTEQYYERYNIDLDFQTTILRVNHEPNINLHNSLLRMEERVVKLRNHLDIDYNNVDVYLVLCNLVTTDELGTIYGLGFDKSNVLLIDLPTANRMDVDNLYQLAIHELAHVFGLHHSDDINNLMYKHQRLEAENLEDWQIEILENNVKEMIE